MAVWLQNDTHTQVKNSYNNKDKIQIQPIRNSNLCEQHNTIQKNVVSHSHPLKSAPSLAEPFERA